MSRVIPLRTRSTSIRLLQALASIFIFIFRRCRVGPHPADHNFCAVSLLGIPIGQRCALLQPTYQRDSDRYGGAALLLLYCTSDLALASRD